MQVAKRMEDELNIETQKPKRSITKFFNYVNEGKPSIGAITRKYKFEEIQLRDNKKGM